MRKTDIFQCAPRGTYAKYVALVEVNVMNYSLIFLTAYLKPVV